jgi:hypothetical protein
MAQGPPRSWPALGIPPATSVCMKTNVALLDRTVRLGAGMLLLASPLLELPTYPFNLVGLVLVATGFVGYCPLYSLLSLNHAR